MFCPQCGQRNPDQARFCAQCGSTLQAGAPAQPAWGGAPAPVESGFGVPPPPSFEALSPPPSPGWPGAGGPQAGPPPPAQPATPYGPPPPPQAGYGVPAYGPPTPVASAPPAYGQAPFYGAAPAMEYKGVMPRFFAAIVDGILTGVAMAVLIALLGGGIDPEALASGELTYALSGAPALLIIALGWGYPIVFEGLFGGTIGKLMLGMRVVNAEGGNAGLGRALVRNLLRLIDMLPLFYLLGVILVASSDTKQRLGDRVAGTYVVAR